MPTNTELDRALITEARRLGKHVSKEATVEDTLRECVRQRKQLEILELFGQIDYVEDYDHKSAR